MLIRNRKQNDHDFEIQETITENTEKIIFSIKYLNNRNIKLVGFLKSWKFTILEVIQFMNYESNTGNKKKSVPVFCQRVGRKSESVLRLFQKTASSRKQTNKIYLNLNLSGRHGSYS